MPDLTQEDSSTFTAVSAFFSDRLGFLLARNSWRRRRREEATKSNELEKRNPSIVDADTFLLDLCSGNRIYIDFESGPRLSRDSENLSLGYANLVVSVDVALSQCGLKLFQYLIEFV